MASHPDSKRGGAKGREKKVKKERESDKGDEGQRETEIKRKRGREGKKRQREGSEQREPLRRQHVNTPTAGLLSGDEEAAG